MARNKNQPRGQDHYCAKLTSEDVLEIRDYLRKKYTISTLAKYFRVSWNTIYDIKIGRTWRHIE